MPSSACKTCALDRKSTRLNSSHTIISYAVFCLKQKNAREEATLRVPAAEQLRSQQTETCMPDTYSGSSIHGSTPPFRLFLSSVACFFFLRIRRPPNSPPFPSTPLFR